jgi:PucR family transcriptional regulator, purine catabolism regulatory protein
VLTVRALVDEMGLSLAAGAGGAQTPLRWVHCTELADPTSWLSGGELILTTGIQLRGAPAQRSFVRRLAAHGLAGVGLGTGFDHSELPEAMVDEARRRDFPLFEVPYEVPFIAITEKAFGHLVNEQYGMLRGALAVQGRLERLVLEGRGLDAVVGAAAEVIGGAVLVLDPRGETMAAQGVGDTLSAASLAALRRAVAARGPGGAAEPVAFAPEQDGRGLALPVGARQPAAPQAWLVAVRHPGELGDFERLVLQQTVTVVALELMRERVRRDTERRLAGDVLAETLTGRLSPDEVEVRLRPFGIADQAAVAVFALEDAAAAEPLLERLLAEAGAPALIALRGSLLCAVIDAGGPDVHDLAVDARSQLAEMHGEVRAAVSRPAPTASLRRSFHEARCALEAAALANGTGPEVATHEQLGSFQLLLSVQDEEALRAYCESLLGPLSDGEGSYGDELVRSLEAFIECNGQWEAAARRLPCHRHTLRYRIKRVEQLTGRDLSSARDRIELWLALQGRELVR